MYTHTITTSYPVTKNWRRLLKECGHLLGKYYANYKEEDCKFSGIMYGEDDYYYVFWNRVRKEYELTSCVVTLEQAGYTLKEEQK
jgi:hypothetical protein